MLRSFSVGLALVGLAGTALACDNTPVDAAAPADQQVATAPASKTTVARSTANKNYSTELIQTSTKKSSPAKPVQTARVTPDN